MSGDAGPPEDAGERDAASDPSEGDGASAREDAGDADAANEDADAAGDLDASATDADAASDRDATAGDADADAGDTDATPRDAALVDARMIIQDPGSGDASVFIPGPSFIAMFAANDSVWAVDTAGVARFALSSGTEVERWSAPRSLSSAAFDGTRLVALDGARLTSLEPGALTVQASGNLIESCAASVLVRNGWLVCGPGNDWQRTFYTYDAASGQLITRSGTFTYNGIPMRRVPQLDAFVTVSAGSPTDYALYTVAPDGTVRFERDSPYHGDFPADAVYAFNGAPPTHLITSQGLLLKFAPGCGATNTCFVKDGALGTLSGSQRFVALDGNGTTLAALVDPTGSPYFPGQGQNQVSFLLQTIDLGSRTVTAQRVISLPDAAPLTFQALFAQGMVVLAVRRASNSSSTLDYDLLTFELP